MSDGVTFFIKHKVFVDGIKDFDGVILAGRVELIYFLESRVYS